MATVVLEARNNGDYRYIELIKAMCRRTRLHPASVEIELVKIANGVMPE
jgi:hypothetical protein